jgi:hypothetical protein
MIFWRIWRRLWSGFERRWIAAPRFMRLAMTNLTNANGPGLALRAVFVARAVRLGELVHRVVGAAGF